MLIHPVVQHLNGAVTVTLQASFVGDGTDATDKQRIGAYGDPLVNLVGTIVDTAHPAIGTITLAGLPSLSDSFVIGSQTFTWVASGTALGNVVIGVDAAACATNIVTSISRDIPSVATAERVGSTVIVTAVTPGVNGNSLNFTEASTNVTMDGSGKLGGTTAGRDALSFQFGAAEVWKGVTTQMAATPVRFMTQLPFGSTGQTPYEAIVADPVIAATVWVATMASRISAVMTDLRAKSPSQLVTLSDSTV